MERLSSLAFALCVSVGMTQTSFAGPAPDCADANGDVNGDKVIDISDAMHYIAYQFQGGDGPVLFCDPAGGGTRCASQNGDVNGDKRIDIADAIYSLTYLFHDTAAPVPKCEPNVACVTYEEVQPVFAAKCSPCHMGESASSCLRSGSGPCFASFYEDTQGPSSRCAGKTMFECMLIRILNGTMPRRKGCSGNPASDTGNDSCLTDSELDMVEAWVTAGAPESGMDTDGDGICDADDGCTDSDGDGVGNGNEADTDCVTDLVDSDDGDPNVCADDNDDGVDDCTLGSYSSVVAGGTWSDVQPILMTKCSPCHVGETASSCLRSGSGPCFASFYEDTQLMAGFRCPGRPVYECMIIRIKNGSMPQRRGCSGSPASDAGNDSCLDQSEIETVEAWALNNAPE